MSWLLAHKGKRKKATRSKAAAGSRPWDPMRTLAAVKVLLLIAALVGAGYGWRYGREALRGYAQRRQAGVIGVRNVVLAEAPGWMNGALRLRLRGLVAAEMYRQPLDGTALSRAVGVLGGSPWVEHVEKVERVWGGRVIVHARYRRPAAVVEYRDGYHLVDVRAVRLPGRYGRGQWHGLGLGLIVGARGTPGPVGEPWPGEDLQAGLALLKVLEEQRLLKYVQSVDVGERDKRGRVCLLLWTGAGRDVRRSPHIVWGLAPGLEHPYEPPALEKARRLAAVVAQRGVGEKIVDISGAAVWQREPLGGDEIRSAEYTARR